MANAILIPQFEPDLSDYALKDHTHSQYLTSHQSLTSYATKTYVQQQISAIDFPDAGVTTFNGRSGVVVPKTGDYTATMVGAAATNHTHSAYALTTHTHSGYASSTHNHDTVYSKLTHTHTTYAAKSHTHAASDITGLSSGSGNVEVYTVSKGTASYTLSKVAKAVLVTQDGVSLQPVFCSPGHGNASIALATDGKKITLSTGALNDYIIIAVF